MYRFPQGGATALWCRCCRHCGQAMQVDVLPLGPNVPKDATHEERDGGCKQEACAIVSAIPPVGDLQLPFNPPKLDQR